MLIGRFTISEQTETRDAFFQRHIRFRRFEGDTTGHQAGEGFTLNLDAAGEAAGQRDAAGIPETRRAVDQVLVFLLDVNTDDQLFVLARELVALHRTHFDLLIEDRAADIQGAKVVREQHHVQAWGTQVQRRRFGTGDELTLWCAAFVAGADGDVVTFDQGFQPRDARQVDGRFDHPELGVLYQVVFGERIEGQLGVGTG